MADWEGGMADDGETGRDNEDSLGAGRRGGVRLDAGALWRGLGPWRSLVGMAALVGAFLTIAYFAGFLRGAGGWLLIGLCGVGLLWSVRDARAAAALSAGPPGPGVVDIEERRIGYFSARGGGFVSLDDLMCVEIRTTSGGPFTDNVFWVLTPSAGRAPLWIPSGARGSDDLLDALGGLPGFDHEQVVRAMTSTSDAVFIAWRRPTEEVEEPAQEP